MNLLSKDDKNLSTTRKYFNLNVSNMIHVVGESQLKTIKAFFALMNLAKTKKTTCFITLNHSITDRKELKRSKNDLITQQFSHISRFPGHSCHVLMVGKLLVGIAIVKLIKINLQFQRFGSSKHRTKVKSLHEFRICTVECDTSCVDHVTNFFTIVYSRKHFACNFRRRFSHEVHN